jgi:hypothetical protein
MKIQSGKVIETSTNTIQEKIVPEVTSLLKEKDQLVASTSTSSSTPANQQDPSKNR